MLLYYFITFLALTVPFNLSLYMQNLHIGNAEKSGTLISIFFLAVTLSGFDINRVILGFKATPMLFPSLPSPWALYCLLLKAVSYSLH